MNLILNQVGFRIFIDTWDMKWRPQKIWPDFLIGCWKHWILNIFNKLKCLDSVWRVSVYHTWCFDLLCIYCQWFENGISSENWSIWIMLFNAAFPPYAHHNATHHIDVRASGRCLDGVWVTQDIVFWVLMPNQLIKLLNCYYTKLVPSLPVASD